MQEIITFIKRFRTHFVFTFLFIISLVMINSNSNTSIGGFRSFMILQITQLQEYLPISLNPSTTRNINKSLRELNLELYSGVVRMKQAEKEYIKLLKLADFKEKTEFPVTTSNVIGKSITDSRTYLTLDRGMNDKILRGMPVRTDAGLVGTIIGVTEKFSLCEVITNKNVKVAIKVQRNDVNGILQWAGNENMKINRVSLFYDVQAGDRVLTSNMSNKYPPNIPVGQIIAVDEDKSTMYYSITLSPYVKFNELEEVFIVKFIPNKERQKLLNNIEKSLINR